MSRNSYILLLPLSMVLISIPLENWSIELSRLLKFSGLSAVVLKIFYNRQRNIYVFTLPLLAIYLLILGLYNNIKLMPALEDGLRYLIPIIALIYGMHLKTQQKIVFKILLGYVLLNDFYQLFTWVFSIIVEKEVFFNRATGFVGYFDFFGFINLVGLVIISKGNLLQLGKYKRYVEVFLIFFILWSLSLKIILIFLVYILIKNYKLIIVPLLFGLILFLTRNEGVINGFWLRINRYIIDRNSARNESYRVAFDNLHEHWLIGKGPGTFGGPASTKYNSILYENYNFNWFGELGLATTDTYYPHLVVELGLVFSLGYLFLIIVAPFLYSKQNSLVITLISFIAINSIFSFALNSTNYCFFAMVIVGLYQEDKRDGITNKIG